MVDIFNTVMGDGGKELLRKIIMSHGTEELLKISQGIDLTKKSFIGSMSHYVDLTKTIEIRDRHNRAI